MNQVELLFFTKHLGVMLKAGIPLTEALATLIEQAKSNKQKTVIRGILKSVETGATLAESVAQYPKSFSLLYQSLIQIGEKSGSLEESLTMLIIQQTKTQALKKKIKSAMMYPMLVLVVTVVLGGAIAFLLLPKLADFFTSFSGELPLNTRILLAIANLVKSHGVLLIILFFGLILLTVSLARVPVINRWLQRVILRIPILGGVVRSSELALFSRNLSAMLKRGIPMNSALSIVTQSQSNYPYQVELKLAQTALESGKSLADSLPNAMLFPPLVTRMIAVGEKTGKLDEVLAYLADFMEDEVDEIAKNLSVLVEPVLLFVIGIVVAFTALAIISPIYGLLSYIQ